MEDYKPRYLCLEITMMADEGIIRMCYVEKKDITFNNPVFFLL